MPMNVTCFGCGQEYSAEDYLLGQEIQCPSCGATIQLPMPALAPTPKPVNVRPNTTRENRRRRPRLNRRSIGLLALGGVALLIVIPTVQAFWRGYQRAAALDRGADEWAVYSTDKYGFAAQLPANFFEQSSRIPGRNTPATRVRAKHVNGVSVDIDLATAPDVGKWAARMFQFKSIEGVIRFPATGIIVCTEFVEESEFHEWNCAMSWGSSFCLVSVFGKDRDAVDKMADKIYKSLRFRAPS